MDREHALELLKQHVKKDNLLKHMYAVEAIMRGLANHFGEDEELWGLTGLLHDIDFESIDWKNSEQARKQHGVLGAQMLEGKVSDEIVRAIRSHNHENLEDKPETKMEIALLAADNVSGLIIACALVMPSKKLADVTADSIAKRYKEKAFARQVRRDLIDWCEKIGLSHEQFYEISLRALQKISRELGL